MTEQEWLDGSDIRKMLRWVRHGTSKRKLRLFACACCKGCESDLGGEQLRQAIDVGERFADGLASEEERRRAWEETKIAHDKAWGLADSVSVGWAATLYAQAHAAAVVMTAVAEQARIAEMFELAVWNPGARMRPSEWHGLLREMIGNPFAHVPEKVLVPLRQDITVATMAHTIYQERRFTDMPILADALEDAGCDNEAVLIHCRQSGAVHMRGCWVLDLLQSIG